MNRTPLLLLACLPLALSALQGCVPAAVVGAGAAVLSYEDRRTSGTQVEDEGIELRAANRIGERYGDKVHINVTSYNRSVLLTGEASDEKTKAEIEKMALGVPNVRGVTNDIQVAGTSSFGARSNDSFITSKIKARFVDGRKFNPVHVKVVTEAAVAYLLGIVTEKEAADAVEIARTTGGVRKVIRVFEYCKSSDELCRPRTQAKGEEAKKK